MTQPDIPSPCTGVCRLHPVTRLCEGCFRTALEIGRWPYAGHDERLGVVRLLRQRRRAAGISSTADASPRRRQQPGVVP